jgi:HlyD family secretion protein
MKAGKVEDAELMHKLGIDSSGKSRKKWKWIIFVALLIILIIIIGVHMNRKGQESKSSYFKIKEIRIGQLTVTVTATGTLKPTKQVDVGSELSGNLETVEVQYNDHVKAGQALATLDGSRYEAQVMQSEASLESAQADVLNAEATEKEAQSKLDRLKEVWELSGNKIPSQTELDAAEAALQRAHASLATANARVSQAQATLDENKTNLSKLIIRSPIDGIVLNRAYEPGQTVQASFQGVTLFTLAEDLSKMELHVDVDEADVGQVTEGQEATFNVDGYPERTFNAHITQVRYGAKTVSGVVTYETVLDVDNNEMLLRPGMTATADIVVDRFEGVMLIDNAAIRFTPSEKDMAAYSSDRRNLFEKLFSRPAKPKAEEEEEQDNDIKTKKIWMLRDNILVPITITTGLTDGIITEVTSGELKAGDKVITGTESGIK